MIRLVLADTLHQLRRDAKYYQREYETSRAREWSSVPAKTLQLYLDCFKTCSNLDDFQKVVATLQSTVNHYKAQK